MFEKQDTGQLWAPPGPSNWIFGHIVLEYRYVIPHVLTTDRSQNISSKPLQHFLHIATPPYTVTSQLHFICFGTADHFIKKEFIKKKSLGHNRGQLSRGIWIQHLAQYKEKKRPTAKRVCPTNVSSGQSIHRVYPWVKTGIVGNTTR